MQRNTAKRFGKLSRRLSATAAGFAVAAAGGAAVAPVADAAPQSVLPKLETPAFSGSGDIADDPAIWVNPSDPAKSAVVATNKNTSGGGIAVYDLAGKLLQFRKDGALNNADIRTMTLGGKSKVVVSASNRTTDSLSFYTLDPATRTLTPVNARTVSTGWEPYGLCMYTSPTSGKRYVFVTQDNVGKVDQYELVDAAGKVDAKKVRSLTLSSQTEGCVADDELGQLFIGEEDKGIWRYGAEPTTGSTRVAIGTVGDGKLTADVEGMTIAKQGDKGGYLIVSSQGNSTYAVYQRGTGTYVKSFSVGANGGIDAVSETDGLDVTTTPLGSAFPNGLLVVHDHVNTGASTTNYKFVDLGQVIPAAASPAPAPAPSEPAPAPAPSAPAPAPAPSEPAPAPSSDGTWWGWNPSSTSVPPLLPTLPFHNNTGLFRAEDRAALVTHNGDFTTSAQNQVIDRKNITGKLIVKHSGVVIKRSWVHGTIENATAYPVRAIHIDLGDGKAGNYKGNGAKGSIHLYRSNVFGVTDGVMTTPGKDTVMQDNFVHDLRFASDSTQSSGKTHNDGFQVNTVGTAKAVIKHNTFFMWSMNNHSEKETATRSSGPNWTDGGSALASKGYSGGSGKPEDGLVNAGIMIGYKQTGLTATIDGNLFRGHTYYDLNIAAGNITVTNNVLSTKENVAGRKDVAGRSNIKTWSNNKSLETGALLP
jgi:3-phytase